MNPKKFEEFERERIVTRRNPDKNRALSIIKEAENKKDFLEEVLKKIPLEKQNPNFIVDHCYDIILENVRAIMLLKGINASGNFAHEAEVSYLGVLGFPDTEVQFVDLMRYYRNGIKYYGTMLDLDYAKQVLEFFNKLYPKLKKLEKV